MKDEFDAAVVRAINEVFPDSVVTRCNIHLSQCLVRQLHNIGVIVEYKQNEDVQHTCRMCAALEYLPINQVKEDLLMIMQMFNKIGN